MVLKELLVKVKADTSNMQTGMKQAGESVDKLKMKTNALGEAGKKLGGVLKGAVTAGLVAVTAAFIGATVVAVKFDDVIIRAFHDSTKGATINSEAFETFAVRARELGKSSLFGATQAALGLQILAAQTYDNVDSMAVLKEAMMLSTATGDELLTSVKAMSQAMKIWKLDSNEASKVATILGTAAIEGTVGLEKFAKGLKNLGPMAKGAGLSFKELVAVSTVLAEEGEMAVMMMKLAMSMKMLQDPAMKVSQIFAKYGIATNTASGELRPFIDIIMDANNAMKGHAGRYQELTAAADISLPLVIKNADAFKKLLITLDGGRPMLKKIGQEFSESLPGAFKRFKAVGEEALLKFADTFKGPLITFIDELGKGLIGLSDNIDPESISGFTNSIIKLVEQLPTLISLTGDLLKAFEPVLWVLDKLVLGLKAIGTWIGQFVGVLSTLDFGELFKGLAKGGPTGFFMSLISQANTLTDAVMEANKATMDLVPSPKATAAATRPKAVGVAAQVAPRQSTVNYVATIQEILTDYRRQIEETGNKRLKTIIGIMEDIFQVDITSEEQLKTILDQKLAEHKKRVEQIHAAPPIE